MVHSKQGVRSRLTNRIAGIPMHSVIGSQTGVYVGCFTKDFESLGGRDPCRSSVSALCNQPLLTRISVGGPFYAATGNGQSMLSNRVSWFFDLRGPSFTIDTACSSSLYAVHLACQSLRTGETKAAGFSLPIASQRIAHSLFPGIGRWDEPDL